MSKEPFIPNPNYTQIPNVFLDDVLPQIKSLAEMKVVLVVMRKTFGFHKRADMLSISQIKTLTGLSHQSVIDGIEAATARGILQRKPRGISFAYAVHLQAEKHAAQVVKNLDHLSESGSQEFRPEVVKNLDYPRVAGSQEFRHTKESTTKESIKESICANRKSKNTEIAFEIYNAYPRKVARETALKSIAAAIARIAAEPDAPPDIGAWLLQRTRLFAQSDKGNAGEYTPHPSTWFNAGRYHDDETTWTTTQGNQNGNSHHGKPEHKSVTALRGSDIYNAFGLAAKD